MKCNLMKTRDGYVKKVGIDLEAVEALVFTRALTRFADDENENATDRIIAIQMVKNFKKMCEGAVGKADTPQEERSE